MTLTLLIGLAFCALMAIRSERLLRSALWLAVASALTSVILYTQGAAQAAVIELSVGAGLVFILFVFAINLAPSPPGSRAAVVPWPAALGLVGLTMLLLAELAWPRVAAPAASAVAPLSAVLWQDRQLDLVVQVVLLFSGALTVAGLLAVEQRAATVKGRVAAVTGSAPAARPLAQAVARSLPTLTAAGTQPKEKAA